MSDKEKSPKELTFAEMKEVIRQELLALQKEEFLTLTKDEEGYSQAFCIAVEIEDALIDW